MGRKVKDLESKVAHLEQFVLQLAHKIQELENKDKEPNYLG